MVNEQPPVPEVSTFKTDLAGKTVIVTGANVGLGLEASRHLAAMNPGRLILACRDPKKGEAAIESIVKDTGCKTIECWALDLGSFESVKAFAAKFEKEGGGKLDVVVENAGVAGRAYIATQDGWEQMIQVNHLSTALLAFRLLPFLLAAPAPRLVIISSGTHLWLKDMAETDEPKILKKLSDTEYCADPKVMERRYPTSKLFNVLFTRALASHLPSSTSLTVNAVDPGLCVSELARSLPAEQRAELHSRARTTEEGSRTLVHAAVAADVQGETGQYMASCKVAPVSEFASSERGKVAQDKLWDETVEILTKVDPAIPKIISEHLS